ncbi:MAG: PAS domain-containing protein, partial [Leptothrix sp. (in: b-proteobacteria)]
AAAPVQAVLVSRNGRRSPIADRAAPVRNAEGELTGVVLLMRDVSAAYRLEQALAESERHHRTLANAGHALIWTTDRSGQPTWANQPWQAFCGEAEPGAWLERVHPDDRERAALDWRACVQHSEAMRLSLRLRRHDGACRWMTLEAVPRSDSQGAPIGHIVFAVDTSREHDAEQRLRDQLDELQRWQAAMFGREQRISALKAEVNRLLTAHGQPLRYPSQSGKLIDPSQHDRALAPTPTDPSARA